MYPFLLSLSLIATAIGVFAIGFGIPNRDFSLGDMLIIVGTVAIVGGMIMFGLWGGGGRAAAAPYRRRKGAAPCAPPSAGSGRRRYSRRGAPGARSACSLSGQSCH